MNNLILQYKFDASINIDLIPEFNEEFINYEIVDETHDNITNRIIYSSYLPSKISFEEQKSLIELNYINTSNLTSTYNLFYNCTNLIYVDLRNSDFSNIETIERMFTYCSNLLKIDGLNDINISKVHNMGGLFSDCVKIKELEVSNWDVSQVTNFGAVFRRCSALSHVDVSKWDTSNGVIMSGIFTNCSNLTEIDVSNWVVGNAETISQMFYGCTKLSKLTLFKYVDINVVTTYLFGKCNNLKNIVSINSDYNTINILINEIPTKSSTNIGIFDIEGVDNLRLVNIELIKSKFWNVYDHTIAVPTPKINGKACSLKCKGNNIAVITFHKRSL